MKGRKGGAVSLYDASHRPVMSCDEKGCKSKFEGNAGMGESEMKERAFSMGWHRNPSSGNDECPGCAGGGEK